MTMRHQPARAGSRGARLAASWALAALALLGPLAGCFDGDDDGGVAAQPPVAETGVPADATASPGAYARFAGSLPLDDRAAPRALDGVEPPLSETAAPEPVN